jgi:undecaprenyl diphosphate synthase
MRLFLRYLRRETAQLKEEGVRLSVIGRRDRLSPEIVEAIELAEAETSGGRRLLLRLAVDYSSRHALLEAVRVAAEREGLLADRPDLAAEIGRVIHSGGPSPDVDLLIRTGGERRLSDFLLWECAYAELLFTPKMWPDYTADDLAAAMQEFAERDRRFGTVKVAV